MRYVFAQFELDPASARLTRDGFEVPVQPKGLQLLGLLIRAAGRVVPREEIEADLWPDVRVTDQSLRQVARRLRAALGEPHDALIETVPGHGLRFAGEARALEPSSPVRLPPQHDRFVGRASELDALEGALRASGLATVLGPGGSGKTRLVVEYARRRGGPAWFCDLTEARDRDDVARSVARALEVPLGSDDPVERVGHALAARGEALLVLDRFEQVTGWAEATVGRWRDRAEQCQFVIASRHRLGLAGEWVVAVGGLSQQDAIELFRVRSEAVGAPAHAAPEIADLVDAVDRLPLAIELAAARSRVLTPCEIARRLTDRFGLLTDEGRRPVLRSMLDWSWDLLDPDERGTLAQLSVFRGGFTLEAAEAVVEPGPIPMLDMIQALVDKSLVQRVDRRFDLLLAVRDYAAERLAEAGAPEVAERRHGAFFAHLGEPDSIDGMDRWGTTSAVADELPNLLAASGRAVGRGDPEVAGGAALAAWAALKQIGPFALATEVALAALRVPGLPGALEAQLRLAAGWGLKLEGRREAAGITLQAAFDRARELGLRSIEIDAAVQIGLLLKEERPEAGRVWIEAALALARELGDRPREVLLVARRALFDTDAGRNDEARVALQEAVTWLRALDNPRREAGIVTNLGNCCKELGRLDEARACYDRALELHRRLGDRYGVAGALGNLGGLELNFGRLEHGRADLEAALELYRRLGDPHSTALKLMVFGDLHLLERRWDAAREVLDEAAALAVDQPSLEAPLRLRRGCLHLELGQLCEAEAELAAVIALGRRTGYRPYEGVGLRDLGRIALELGRRDEARARLDEAEAVLTELRMINELALVWCTRAVLEARLGDLPAARALIERARAAAASIQAGPRSELGQRLAQVEASVRSG